MVEKTLIVIITLVFFLTCWWWSNQQNMTESFYEEQLRGRDAVITQLCILALPQVQGKTSDKVQAFFQNIYPQSDVRNENGIIFSNTLGVRFSKDAVATGFFLPWDEIEETPAQ